MSCLGLIRARRSISSVVQILGLVGSPGKGKHTSLERVRRGMLDVCEALNAHVIMPMMHLHDLEARLHGPQVYMQGCCICITFNSLPRASVRDLGAATAQVPMLGLTGLSLP